MSIPADGVTRRVHMCLCVRGALRKMTKRQLGGLFTKDDGSQATAAEAVEYLKLCDYKGWEVIPMGDCDNFDYKTGCRGHPVPGALTLNSKPQTPNCGDAGAA